MKRKQIEDAYNKKLSKRLIQFNNSTAEEKPYVLKVIEAIKNQRDEVLYTYDLWDKLKNKKYHPSFKDFMDDWDQTPDTIKLTFMLNMR